jgi:hypothetical protein
MSTSGLPVAMEILTQDARPGKRTRWSQWFTVGCLLPKASAM